MNASSCFEGKVDCRRRESQGLMIRRGRKNRMSGTGKRKPYMESLFKKHEIYSERIPGDGLGMDF